MPGAEGTGREDEPSEGVRVSADAEARPTPRFDWRGWTLVAAVVLALVVVPWTIVALPPARSAVGGLGLPWRDAYLVLPLVPAFLLGALAVWSAVRSRAR